MIEHVLEAVRKVVDRVQISGHSGIGGIGGIQDRYPGAGPLAGLHAALCEIETRWVLLVAADMPYLTPDILQQIVTARFGDVKAVVARTPEGRLQPLCACYRSDILPIVEEQIRNGRLSMHALLDAIGEMQLVDVPEGPLRNVNRRDDVTLPPSGV